MFGLPPRPPRTDEGLKCTFCVNRCQVSEGERGYCGVRLNKDGKFVGGRANEGNFSWYYDNLPTNCVAKWVCPAGTDCGYPGFSYARTPEYGYKNLAVFFHACTFNCLFCQNWHYRKESTRASKSGADELTNGVDGRTACICYFGGDPTPQLPFAIKVSKEALEKAKNRVLRICWETNGSMSTDLLKEMAEISLKSGGCIKFDLKAYDEGLHIALCGITNRKTLENFTLASKYIIKRKEPPFLVASTLLVPGYIDEKEVSDIAKFIARLDRSIPYSLLGFAPNFYMPDLPYTSKREAEGCLKAAKEAGLMNIHIGNIHILH